LTATKRLAAGAGLVSQARLVGGVLNIVTLVALTRLLPKADFAVVALVYLVQETINAIGPLGLPSALSFFVPKLGPSVARALGLYTGRVLLLLSLPYALALGFGGPMFAEWAGKPEIATPLSLLAIGLIADFPGQTLPGYLIATEKFIGAFWVTLVFYLSRFASLVIPAALGADISTIIGLFAAVAVLRGLMFLVYFVFIAEGELGPEIRTQWTLKELFAFGLPLSLSAIVGKLNVQLDKYLIITIAAAEVFAIYTVGATQIPLVPGIAYSVTTALVPTMVLAHGRGDNSGFVKLWHGAMTKVSLAMMPVFAGLFVLAEPLVRILFSAEYTEAAVPFRVYLFLLPLRLCAYGAVVRALGKTKPVLIAAVAGLTANAALNYPMYALLGLAGPAVASILAQLVSIVILLYVIRHQLSIGWKQVFPYRAVGHALAIAVVAAVPLALAAPSLLDATGHRLTDDIIALAGGGGVYLAIYLVLGRLGGLISADDLRYLVDFLTGRLAKRAKS
jgi:O-antigen/teichoic acid export membrane protein